MAVIMSEILGAGSQLAFAAFAGNQRPAVDRKPGEAVLAGNQRPAADRKPVEAALAGNFSSLGYPAAFFEALHFT